MSIMQQHKIDIYKNRRNNLLGRLEPNSIAIITTHTQKQRNSDVYYPYRGHSNFLYLTNFNEPETVAILFIKKSQPYCVLFVKEIDETSIIWNGDRLGVKNAVTKLLVDEAYNIVDFPSKIVELIAGFDNIYYDFNDNQNIDTAILKAVDTHKNKHQNYQSLKTVINEMRLIKEDSEITSIRQAIAITAQAFLETMTTNLVDKYEYEVAAIFDKTFKENNTEHAYPAIVAGGGNACTLHYVKNNKKLIAGELLLIDAGAEYSYYAADITRVMPINGKFSIAQKAIYEIVLDAQKSAIASIKPDSTIEIAYKAASECITCGLRKLGILKANSNVADLKRFFMHNIGHWLGLDVHDVGNYKIDNKSRKLKTGMIITVEPGIYIKENIDIDKKYWNIGIRIEDDVLVTNTGHEVLSAKIIKETKQIEALRKI